MKALALFLFVSTAASAQVVKTCNTRLASMDSAETVEMRFEIIRRGSEHVARMTQPQLRESYEEAARIIDFPVRAGLVAVDMDDLLGEVFNEDEDNSSDYNFGEGLIIHAMTLEADEDFGSVSQSGINLANVRSVRVYLIGAQEEVQAPIGVSAIVEAKDARGRVMGSFLGGLAISPCR
jgi:hypothetical protein